MVRTFPVDILLYHVFTKMPEEKPEKVEVEPKSEPEKVPSADDLQKPAAPVKHAGPKTPVIKVIKRAGESSSDSSAPPSEPKSDLTPEPKSETKPETTSTQTIEPAVEEKPVTEEKPAQTENEPDSGEKPSESDQQATTAEPPQPVRKRSIPVINVIGHREERKKPADAEKKGKEERRRGPLQRLLAPMPEVKQPAQK